MQDTDRVFHPFNNSNAEDVQKDHGYLLLGMDRNANRYLQGNDHRLRVS